MHKCCTHKINYVSSYECVILCHFFCSVMPVLHFISGVVRRDVTTSLLVECTVEAVPPVTFVEIRRRDEEGDVVLSAMSGNSQMLTLQYTLGYLMVNDSGVYVCVANNSIGTKEQNVTLVVQGESTLNIMLALRNMTTTSLA